jgi:ribosome-associated toxin RatA of RatAB toxin-antitoxin module
MRGTAVLATAVVSTCHFVLAPAVWAEPGDTTWIDFDLLEAGEVVLRTDKLSQGGVTIDAAVLIGASAETIFEILKACEIAPDYVPNVVDCTLIDSVNDGRSELFIQTVKPAFFIPAFEHVFRLDYHPFQRIDVRRVSGPLAVMDGAWTLVPHGNGRIVLMHSLDIRPGFPVPRLFVRATLKRDLPTVLKAVRDRAEAAD